MSTLNIRSLAIRADTSDGLYGLDMPFSKGLNIIHADNTLGKSTCIQAIIFALGLEGCLGPSRKLPLKSALKSNLKNDNTDDIKVIKSKIYLEISNGSMSVVLARSSDEISKDLISVYKNQIMSEVVGGNGKHDDYYLNREGAATRERGFHHYLASFLNIEQPKVLKYDGSESPMYLEAIFSINYVEQTRGWGGILNVLPTYLGIRDLASKVIEFTLDLDVQDNIIKKQRYGQDKRLAENRWNSSIESLKLVAFNSNGNVLSSLLGKISNIKYIRDESYLYAGTNSDKEYSTLLDELKSELNQIQSAKINNYIDDNKLETLSLELERYSEKLKEDEKIASVLVSDLDLSKQYVDSIKFRLEDITESLRKYKDILRLKEIGSQEVFDLDIGSRCPTCFTKLDETLLDYNLKSSRKVLGLEDNIQYLEKQRAAFNSLIRSEEVNSEKKQYRLKVINDQLNNTRELIRQVKTSLTDVSSAPSRSNIKKELILENQIEILEKSLLKEDEIKEDLREALKDWNKADKSLKALSKMSLSKNDFIKLNVLKESFGYYLEKFGYTSNAISDFSISLETYKPMLNGVDINSEASASDNIRVIWAFLYAVLMLDNDCKVTSSNHLGLLILDEPRQQEAKNESFNEFIATASKVGSIGKQIIVGTSEDYGNLQAAVKGLDIDLKHFDSYLIRKL